MNLPLRVLHGRLRRDDFFPRERLKAVSRYRISLLFLALGSASPSGTFSHPMFPDTKLWLLCWSADVSGIRADFPYWPKVVPAPHQVRLTHPTSFSCTHSTSELTRWPISRSRDYVFALPPMKHGFGMPFRCPPGAPAGPTIRIGAIHLFFCTHVCCGSMNRPCFDVEGSDSSMHRSQEENERD